MRSLILLILASNRISKRVTKDSLVGINQFPRALVTRVSPEEAGTCIHIKINFR